MRGGHYFDIMSSAPCTKYKSISFGTAREFVQKGTMHERNTRKNCVKENCESCIIFDLTQTNDNCELWNVSTVSGGWGFKSKIKETNKTLFLKKKNNNRKTWILYGFTPANIWFVFRQNHKEMLSYNSGSWYFLFID